MIPKSPAVSNEIIKRLGNGEDALRLSVHIETKDYTFTLT